MKEERRVGLGFWGFKMKRLFCPHLLKNDHFTLNHANNTCHYIKKSNVVTQKMHIACNYKAWRVHYLILNSMGQCEKHSIVWGGKV